MEKLFFSLSQNYSINTTTTATTAAAATTTTGASPPTTTSSPIIYSSNGNEYVDFDRLLIAVHSGPNEHFLTLHKKSAKMAVPRFEKITKNGAKF